MTQLFDQVQEATAAVRAKWGGAPVAGIILGTGLGGLVEEIQAEAVFPYGDLPHFPVSTAPSHKGQLVCGQLAGKTVVAMEGRFHYYEGYSTQQITLPVRVMKALGCPNLIISNASGGLNPQFSKGDIMVIEDHIGLFMENPLRGPNDDRLGPRFPDMCEPYDKGLLRLAREVAREERVPCQQGVFVAVPGPNLETRAEYRVLRQMGADAVGMSTVPEIIVAVHSGLRCLGLSIVTDMCLADALEPVSLPDIIATANAAERKLRVLVRRVVEKL
ncbi:MAG: purine-nucleoside phosphorylase [Gemmataceae bacterium]